MPLDKHHKGTFCDPNTTAYIPGYPNKNDFSICLKVCSVTARSLSIADRALQDVVPEVLKARRPRVAVCVHGTSS